MSRTNWRLSYVGEAVVISPGLIFYANKRPKGISLEDVLAMVKKHPSVSYYEKTIKRRVTLAQALQSNFDDLGKEREMFSSIDLNHLELDRKFDKVPRTGKQLLNNQYTSQNQIVTDLSPTP